MVFKRTWPMSFYHIIEKMISGEDRARRYRSKEKILVARQ